MRQHIARERKCSCCGKNLCFLSIDMRNWAYKTLIYDRVYEYQCSYTCWRKETKRLEEENDKRKNNTIGCR